MFKYDKKLLAIWIITLMLIIIFFSIMILNWKSENQKVTQIINTWALNNLDENKQKINEFKNSFDEVSNYYQTLIWLIDLQNEVLNSSLTDKEKEIWIKYIDWKFNDNISVFKTAIENLNIPNLENTEDKSKLEVWKQEMLKWINDISNKTFPDLSLKWISDITNVIKIYLPNYVNNTILGNNKEQIKNQLLNLFKEESPVSKYLDCIVRNWNTCFINISDKAYIDFFEAKWNCEVMWYKLPSKEQIVNNYDKLKPLFENTKILYVWTNEEYNDWTFDYGWVQSVNDIAWNSNWAKADSKLRDYVWYLCVQ